METTTSMEVKAMPMMYLGGGFTTGSAGSTAWGRTSPIILSATFAASNPLLRGIGRSWTHRCDLEVGGLLANCWNSPPLDGTFTQESGVSPVSGQVWL